MKDSNMRIQQRWRARGRLGLVAMLLAFVFVAAAASSALAQDVDAVPADQAQLVINEIMADNGATLAHPDPENRFPDWIEIYNPTAADVSMDGLSISDSPDNPTRGEIPNGYVVPAQGYLLFYFRADPFLNYGLSKDGEFVGLFHAATGTVIDSMEFGPQEEDISIGRDPNGTGEFVSLPQPTPGGHNQELPPRILSVTRNIAVPSSSNTPVISAEITDDGTVVTATLVYSTTDDADTSIVMAKATGNIWKATLPAFADGMVVHYEVRAVDDEGLEASTRRYGYEVGYVGPVLYINEIVVDNPAGIGHEDVDDPGQYPDWAEIYNPGDTPVSLDGLYLTDDPQDTTMYPIPAGKVVPAHGYLMIYADERSAEFPATSKAIHTNFGLSANGDYLGLYGGEGAALIHGIEFDEQGKNIGYGLYPDGEGAPRFLPCVTPGAANMGCDAKSMLPLSFGTPEEPAP